MFSSVAIVCSPYGSTSDTGRKGLAPPLKKRTKEQYCIGTCNVRSMNQGKLEVVKQEMATVNINIPGISELKWTGMGECNSDDHCIYYCGQESLRRNGVAIMVNKRVQFSSIAQSCRTLCDPMDCSKPDFPVYH